MPRIPLIDYEARVQVGDKTRFDAEKSFVTKDITDAITAIKIAPGSDAAINVFDEDPRHRWLDWIWTDWKWDIDSTLNKVYFSEGASDLVATIPDGEYSFADLLAEIATQMNAVGGLTYTAVANEFNEVTLSADGVFGLEVRNKAAALLFALGFRFDSKTDKDEHCGGRVEIARRKVVVTLETTEVVGEVDDDTNMETDDVVTGASKTFYVDLLTPETDYLFSTDQDLIAEEPDIMKWVTKGRATHLSIHRKAQQHIIDWLDRNGYRDVDGERLDKWAFVDLNQVKLWSSYAALKFIFKSISNAVDDVFADKAEGYEKLEIMARNRAVLELAFTKEGRESGKPDKELSPSSWSGTITRG